MYAMYSIFSCEDQIISCSAIWSHRENGDLALKKASDPHGKDGKMAKLRNNYRIQCLFARDLMEAASLAAECSTARLANAFSTT